MSFSQRPKSLAEIGQRIREGAEAGYEVRDFLHEYQRAGSFDMLLPAPPKLAGCVKDGERFDAFLQALAVYLAAKLAQEPPDWTYPMVQLKKPWFASPGLAIRNFLLISSPGPFRSRNMFIDEDSLQVA